MQHRILVVDDDFMNREIIAELIADDYDLAFAENGLEAIEVAEQFRPALVLLDIMMPGLNGYETCERLKKNHPFTKVILVSAKALASERLRGYDVGADDYVTKPFDPPEFQAKIRVFLRLGFVEEIARKKSDLLVLLAHETRTPLSHILSCAEILETQDVSTEARELPRIIVEGALRLTEIFEKSMTLFGIESDLENTPTESLDMYELISTETHLSMDRQGVPLDFSGEEGLWMDGDEDTMRQAIQILCDFFVERRSTSATSTQIECRSKPKDAQFLTSVRFSDDGESDPVRTPRLFELLSVDDVDHHNSSDLNFDLPICAAILRRHGGSIQTVIRPEGGLTCEILLPQSMGPSQRATKGAA